MDVAGSRHGMVGQALAGGLSRPGHSVSVGTRDPASTLARTEPDGMGNPPFVAWHADHPGVRLLGEATTVFVSGDDAKATVTELLTAFGHQHVIDLGGIETAHGTEMLLPPWLRTMGALGIGLFNIKVVR